jgi:hypothetical protein
MGRVGDGEAGGDVDGWPGWWKRLTPHLGVHASWININDAPRPSRPAASTAKPSVLMVT